MQVFFRFDKNRGSTSSILPDSKRTYPRFGIKASKLFNAISSKKGLRFCPPGLWNTSCPLRDLRNRGKPNVDIKLFFQFMDNVRRHLLFESFLILPFIKQAQLII